MLLRYVLLFICTLALDPGPGASAQTQQMPKVTTEQPEAAAAALLAALGMGELVQIMRSEGLAYAADLEAEMFPGRGGAGWPSQVEQIYDPARMEGLMVAALAERMTAEHMAENLAFFEGDTGRRIVALELSARRALLDSSVEETSHEMLFEMRAEADPRLDMLDRFITVNDLVELNVVGALNSNLAFYQGLVDGGGFGVDVPEEDMLRDVWAQEPDVRVDTELWVWSYLAMAYRPLSDAELNAYIEASEAPAGRALNSALFGAFDVLFTTISRDLGLAAARFMAGEDI